MANSTVSLGAEGTLCGLKFAARNFQAHGNDQQPAAQYLVFMNQLIIITQNTLQPASIQSIAHSLSMKINFFCLSLKIFHRRARAKRGRAFHRCCRDEAANNAETGECSFSRCVQCNVEPVFCRWVNHLRPLDKSPLTHSEEEELFQSAILMSMSSTGDCVPWTAIHRQSSFRNKR